MEYNNADIQNTSTTSTPDILTQSLTRVFSAPPSTTPPTHLCSSTTAAPPTVTHPAPPAVVLPTSSVSQSPGEVYAVPIQRYPDFQLSAAQKNTTVESGHVISGNEEGSSATAPGAGDLISEAWSLSCDMTLAWQKENNPAPANVPTMATNTEAVNNAPAPKEMVPNRQKGVVNETEVHQNVPETIPVTVVEIPVKDCEMVDNNGESIKNSIRVEESEQNGLDSAQGQVNIRSAKVTHDRSSPSKQVTATVDKENQENRKLSEAESSNEVIQSSLSTSKIHQSPDTSKKADNKKSETEGVASPQSSAEVKTPEAKRKRIRSGESPNSSTPTRGSDSSERPQRKRKLPQKLCDDNVLNHSKETSFILKEHSKSQMASKLSTKPSTTTAEDAEAERLKQLKVKQFQRLYVMSQRGYIPENPENSNIEEVEDPPSVSPPESPDSASPRRTFSLMDIGISLNAKGEVTLSMPDDIKKLAKSGGSININFDMDCLDEDNCLKFKVTEDKEAITSALGNNENNDAPLIESETSSEPERSDSPKIKIEPEEASETSQITTTKTSVVPSRDSSVQVDLNITNSEEDYLNERLMRASTATGFVSYPRFTNVTGSSLATVHKVLKNVKKGLSIDKFTKKPTWFCSLCNLTGDYGDMGPLFGPFDIYVPPKNSYRNKNMSEGAKNLFEKLSSTFNKDMPFNDENEITVEREEVWLHEDCICWSPGVYMIGFDIYGLEEIFKVARFTVCSDCGEIGASLGCFKEGCSNRYHYRCAIKAKCKLIKSTFTVLCPTHSYGVVDNCLAVKPLMKVRNYLSQEEINESEELLSRRPGEEAREVAVKITKTRIIRSRKSKKTKKKTDGVGRKSAGGMLESFEEGTPGKLRRFKKVVEQEEEEEEEGEVEDDHEAEEGDEVERKPDRPSYECLGCGFQVTTLFSIKRHFKLHPNCRTEHINEAVKMEEPCNPVARVCFSCGHYVPLGQMMVHLRNVPQSRCMTEHYRVIREVRGVDPEKYFDEDRRSAVPRRRGADDYHFKCYGCSSSYATRKSLTTHLKMYEGCRQGNLKHLIAHKNKVHAKYKVCYGCGTLVLKSASLILHLNRNPSCHERHNQVVSEEFDGQTIYGRDGAAVEVEDSDNNESEEENDNVELAIKLYCSHGKGKIYCSFDKIHSHLRSNEDCIAHHVQGFLESEVLLPGNLLICTNCGRYSRNTDKGINVHLNRYNYFGCKFEHMKRSGRLYLEEENRTGGQIDGQSDDEEKVNRQKDHFIPKIYCRHGPRQYSNFRNAHRHLRNYDSCLQPHIHGFLKSGEHLPGDWLLCINCGKYVRGSFIRAHLLRSAHGDCAVKHLVKGGGSEIEDLGEDLIVGDSKAYLDSEDDDHEDVEMRDIEEEEGEGREIEVDKTVDDKRSEVEGDAHNRGKNPENESDGTEKDKVNESGEIEVTVEPVKVKVEMISTSELPHQPSSSTSSPAGTPAPSKTDLPHQPSSSTSSPAGTPAPSKTDLLIHCSQCDTKTKDRSYLKKHYRAQHCPVGCGDYDLICTTCVEALKKIVTFPRGLEGFDYNSRLNKEGLKCPECLTVSQKHNTHYIRKHYRDQHCKIGCAKYDQICTGCVAVLEKLTDWPKPLIGHDYSTGPPPVGFQCPKCKKGIDRQYFKRHYRHLHCKFHCIEKEGVCKKCFLVFKKMGMLTKSDGPGVEYKTK